MPNTPPEKESWEIEFDNKFNDASYFCSCYEGDVYGRFNDAKSELKAFIHSEREAAKREEQKKMRRLLQKWYDKGFKNGQLSSLSNPTKND
jgi:hypothetical protein